MNKKMKRAAALMASAVLCLSMGMNVFAADSMTPEDLPNGDVTGPETPGTDNPNVDMPEAQTPAEQIYQIFEGKGTDADGNKITVRNQGLTTDVEEILKDQNQMKDILTDAGYVVPDDASVVVLGAGDYTTDQEIVGEADMNFVLGSGFDEDLQGIKNGDTIYVLHQKHDGTWEVIEGKAVVRTFGYGDTQVSVDVTMTGFSPVAFIKVMSNGELVVLDKNEVPKASVGTKTTTVTVKTSPKTGE